MADAHDAVVLAGGRARRLDGADKPGLVVGGLALLDRVLGAVPDAGRVLVVGPQRPTRRPVTWLREEPIGGGPVAALAAALPYVTAPRVVLLAADLPFLDAATVQLLLTEASDRDGALLVDDGGRDQLLVGAWRSDALRRAMPPGVAGARLASVLGTLDAARVVAPTGQPWFDCDTETDLTTARGRA